MSLSASFGSLQPSCTWWQVRLWSTRQETVLKYAVEVKIPRSTAMLGLLEPLLERVVYQDIPVNLEAIKKRVELRLAQEAAQGTHSCHCACTMPFGILNPKS